MPSQLWFWMQSTLEMLLNSNMEEQGKKTVVPLSPTWSLWTSPMHEAKHIATSLTDSSHLTKNRKVMNNKGHLISLLLRKVLCMPQDSKSCDVCSCMCIESVHESSSYKRGRRGGKGSELKNQEKQFFNNIAQFEWNCIPLIWITLG